MTPLEAQKRFVRCPTCEGSINGAASRRFFLVSGVKGMSSPISPRASWRLNAWMERAALWVMLWAVFAGTSFAASAPAFTTQPFNQNRVAGQTLQLVTLASGDPAPTYSWERLPAGTATWATLSDTANYTGTGTRTLTIVATLAMSGDQFRCTASNNLGSVISSAATITISPATAPSITSNPVSRTVVTGEYASFSMSGTGSSPLTARWQRKPISTGVWADLIEGGAYSGTASGTLTVLATLAMSGDEFRCTITNVAGSAVTSAAILTVTPVIAPSIAALPATASILYGGYFSVSATVSGTSPITLQWFKNGNPITGANSSFYSKSNCTTSDGGNYHLTATNSAGSASSSVLVLTVAPVIAPTIVNQPAAVTVSRNYSANFSVSATGSPTLTFQWFKNGQAITGATSSSYYISSASAGNSGSYTVRVTNDGGSVTSNAAELTVLPAILPDFSYYSYGPVSISQSYPYFSLNLSVTGTSPMTYQWFKDGVAIAGATSYYYSKTGTAADAGIYTLRVTNEGGVAMSPDVVVVWDTGATGPWLDAVQQGEIVYFLAASPGRIMRYDLSQESWLPIVFLPETKVPTAFLPTAEGVFIAYNLELVRRTLDLQTETPVVTSTEAIRALFAIDQLIYYQEGQTTRSRNRSTLAAGPNSSLGYYDSVSLTRPVRPVFAANTRTLYTTRPTSSPNDIEKYSVSAMGVLSKIGDSPYHGEFNFGSRQYMSPDNARVFDNSGIIYANSTLVYSGSLGQPFDDLLFLSNGTPVLLRSDLLTVHGGSSYAETGQYRLASRAYAIFERGGAVFSFAAPVSNSTNPGVTKVSAASFAPVPLPVPGSPVHKMLSVDDAFIDPAGVIHLVSNTEQGIVRWSTTTRSFLTTLALRGRPAFSSYAKALDRLALIYSDGALTDIFPSSPVGEQIFGYFPSYHRPTSFITMDDLVFLNTSYLKFVLDDVGDTKTVTSASYGGAAQAWQSSTRRLYSNSYSFQNGVDYVQVPLSGVLPNAPAATATDVVAPLHLSSDGTLILSANQKVLNANLQQVGTITNAVTDGVWLSSGLVTVRTRPNGTQVQKWARITYGEIATLSLPGTPLRIFSINDTTLVVVGLLNGYLSFSLVGSDLTLISSTINVLITPSFTTNPSSQSVLAGDPVTFTAVADGQPAPTFQWRKNGVNIPGATSSSYTLAKVLVGDLGSYSVVATNSAGSATSTSATLSITTAGVSGVVPAGFDASGYLARYPDVAAVFGTNLYAAWLYYRDHGIYQGEVFDDLFRGEEYLGLYSELYAVFGTNLSGALVHWLQEGRLEGRLGRVPLDFSSAGYFARNGDVAAAVNSNLLLGWQHFWNYGLYEGRAYDDEFRVFEYLALNPDLQAAFLNDWRGATMHWMRYGRTEGRLGRLPVIFNATTYATLYPGVAAVWGTAPTTLWQHFWLYGIDEGKVFDNEFRVDEYLALNPDIQAMFGINRRGALIHWIRYGRAEGRPGKNP